MTLSNAVSMRFAARCRAACFWLAAGLAAASPTQAQTTGSIPGRCAHLGEGFVPVAGSNACVRIGGHVRADIYDVRPSGASDAARSGLRPIAEQRIRAGSGWTGLYPR
jgi:hypothetical protein